MRRTLAFGTASAAVLATFGIVLPVACFYPDYSFDESTEATGGATVSSGPTSGPASGGGGTGPSSGGNGGAPVGGGGAASSSSVGGNLGEDCTNGIDDDDDVWVDCEDTECFDFSCVPPVPQDWVGYYALYDGPVPDPGCPATFPGGPRPNPEFLGSDDLQNDGPATCAACTCANPTGMTCNLPGLTIRDAQCGMQATYTGPLGPPPSPGVCHGPDGFGAGDTTCGANNMSPCNVSVLAAPATVTGGTCQAGGGTPTKPTPTWAALGHACGNPLLTGAGCNVNQVCLPKPPSDFVGGVCIMQTGNVSCPPQFPDKHIFYQSFMDTRSCSGCSCGGQAGATCTVSYQLFSDLTINTCTIPLTTVNSNACVNISNNPAVVGRIATITQPPNGGNCPPSGGQPTGDVTEQQPTTFCCIP